MLNQLKIKRDREWVRVNWKRLGFIRHFANHKSKQNNQETESEPEFKKREKIGNRRDSQAALVHVLSRTEMTNLKSKKT